ncbi:MAG: MFS transporter [Planctomycetaceae bacterium]
MNDRPTTVRYRTMAWLTVAAALAYLCRNAVGTAESTIRDALGLTLRQSGWFMGSFFWTYALLQIPGGWFAQRLGTRISLTVFALAWSMATFGIAAAPAFWLLIVAQLVMGFAQAGIFPASCNSVGYWMPFSQRSLACGLLAAGMQVGAIAAAALTGRLIAPFGWRWVFAAFAAPGILWAMGFYIRFRDRPEQDPRVNDAERKLIASGQSESGRSDPASAETFEDHSTGHWTALLTRPVIWLLCGQQACRAAGYMFFASWFPTFLQETRGVSTAESGYQQGLVLTGTLVGSILGGMLTDWVWRRSGSVRLSRSGVGAAAIAACAGLILAAWFVKDVNLAVALLAAGALFAALAGPCAYAATIDIGGRHVPQVFGLMNMCGNLAAAACPVLVAWLFDWTANWDLVLLMFAGVYLTGAVCWLFVDPRQS